MKIICFDKYEFSYAVSEKPALSGVSFSVEEGEVVVVCGKSGSGKSTLIKCLKEDITPPGTSRGIADIGINQDEISVVFQDPDTQLINETVLDDLVFHMENLAYDNKTMRKNLAETAGFFGLEPILHKKTSELSGGQKQLVSLCAALMTRPKLLLLDEPTSQLDPIATRDFWDTVIRVHEEFGITMVITEHRLDDVAAFADKVIFMDNGGIIHFGETGSTFTEIFKSGDEQAADYVPDIPRLGLAINLGSICFSPREFKKRAKAENVLIENKKYEKPNNAAITMKNVFFAYENSTEFIIKNMHFELYSGENLCILGGNGAGKSTFLKLLCKLIKPVSGIVSKTDKITAYMPQNIKSYFRFDTIREELEFDGGKQLNKEINDFFGINDILDRHPFDISGGEAQRVVLAALLSRKPDILVLDEPTKGLDPTAKKELCGLLRKINSTIVMSTHDLKFAAEFADRCAMIFDGGISLDAPPREFFSGNNYYTTQINLGVRHLCKNAVTYEEGLSIWKQA